MDQEKMARELWEVRETFRQIFAWKEDNMTLEKEHILAIYVQAYFVAKGTKQVEELKY